MRTDVLIVGGGLSGLALARVLHAQGREWHLVEARPRLGGRILTETFAGGAYDLGPAWFWPGQPRMAAMVDALGLTRFDQFAQGDPIYEDAQGHVHRAQGAASMEGSYRVAGGLGALISALADTLPTASLQASTPIAAISQSSVGITAHTGDGQEIDAKTLVLALPPRLIDQITFAPALLPTAIDALRSVPTWMAGQAKAVAVFDQPFWRQNGLSGDGFSRLGPMVEIHDASPHFTGPAALFGFIGVPSNLRRDAQTLDRAIRAQLVRLFGHHAANPLQLLVKDWAFDPHTSTEADQHPLYTHPRYGMPQAVADLWEGALVLGGTEVATNFGGFLEGALEAAEAAATKISVR